MTKSMLAAGALILAGATISEAASFDVFQQSDDVFESRLGVRSVVGGRANFPDGSGGNKVAQYGFGALYMADRETGTANPLSDFMAFCVELAVPLTTSEATPVVYTSPANLFAADRTQLLGTLLKNVYDESEGKSYQGALAMTIWKIVHGDISSPAGDAFDLSAESSFGLGTSFMDYDSETGGAHLVNNVLEKRASMAALSASWLEALDGDGVGDWVQNATDIIGLRFYESATSQDLVAYDPPDPIVPPVPLPAGILLLGSGLAILGARKTLS